MDGWCGGGGRGRGGGEGEGRGREREGRGCLGVGGDGMGWGRLKVCSAKLCLPRLITAGLGIARTKPGEALGSAQNSLIQSCRIELNRVKSNRAEANAPP